MIGSRLELGFGTGEFFQVIMILFPLICPLQVAWIETDLTVTNFVWHCLYFSFKLCITMHHITFDGGNSFKSQP
jgi:hypothetical protein